MTRRSDIAPSASGWRRLSYTRRCGWVDWGHALPYAARRLICGEVSVADSYRIWDEHVPGGLGRHQNRTFQPRLYPTTEGVRSPADLRLPPELATIRPSAPGSDWVAVQQRYVSQRLIDAKAIINVRPDGFVDVARPGTIAFPHGGGT